MPEPRAIVRRLERDTVLPPGSMERFRGYAVLGVAFSSGHVLAMRSFPASSVGPGYTSVWHREPGGGWTMWVDVDPLDACPRYFGSAVERAVRTPIEVSWPDERRMVVRLDDGDRLDWELRLAPTPATRLLNAVGRVTPNVLWRRRSVLSAMAAVAGPMLRAGRLTLHGTAPNGQWFKANPRSVWVVDGGVAALCGTDLGYVVPLDEAVSLRDFVIPRRGILAVGDGLFEPYREGRHLAVASRGAEAVRPR